MGLTCECEAAELGRQRRVFGLRSLCRGRRAARPGRSMPIALLAECHPEGSARRFAFALSRAHPCAQHRATPPASRAVDGARSPSHGEVTAGGSHGEGRLGRYGRRRAIPKGPKVPTRTPHLVFYAFDWCPSGTSSRRAPTERRCISIPTCEPGPDVASRVAGAGVSRSRLLRLLGFGPLRRDVWHLVIREAVHHGILDADDARRASDSRAAVTTPLSRGTHPDDRS
jgi:hypothetical protein